jgi:hypothetical protein
VNGDSYAVVSDGKRYSEYLSEYLNCESINAAISGSCNSRIFRTSLRDLIKLRQQHNNIVAVISLSFPLRTELWDLTLGNHNRFKNDGDFTSIQTTTSKNWRNEANTSNSKYKNFVDQWLRWYSIEAETVKMLQDILLLTSWCKGNNIKYVIFSGPLQEPVDLSASFIKPFFDEVTKDKNIINIFEKSFTSWCIANNFTPIDNFSQEVLGNIYNIGHHGEAAHRAFASYLIENYLYEI